MAYNVSPPYVLWIYGVASVLHCRTGWETWLLLKKLDIWDCKELRSLPSSIQRLTNLSSLSIRNCPHLEKRCKRETGEDWQYINHIPYLELFARWNRLFMVSSIVLRLLLSLVCQSLLENCVSFFGVCISNRKIFFITKFAHLSLQNFTWHLKVIFYLFYFFIFNI